MPRTMYDSINPASIPANATMVAGYVDGLYSNMTALSARFPGAVRVGIAVFASTDNGTVLDVETGDATPAQAPGWVRMRRARGIDPTVYCNADTWPAVRAAFRSAGVAEPRYWIAQYDGVAVTPAGAIAKQYRETTGWDISVVADYWPGVDPAPTTSPAGPASTPPEDDMLDDATKALWNGMMWGLKNTCEATQKQVGQLQQQLSAQQATITTLAGLLSAQHPGVDTAAVVTAVQAAIAQAVVHVDVTGVASTPAATAAKPAG